MSVCFAPTLCTLRHGMTLCRHHLGRSLAQPGFLKRGQLPSLRGTCRASSRSPRPSRVRVCVLSPQEGRVEVVEVLLAAGGGPEAEAMMAAKDETGYTGLMLAAYAGHEEVLLPLLQVGSSLHVSWCMQWG